MLSPRINLPWSWCPVLLCTVESGFWCQCAQGCPSAASLWALCLLWHQVALRGVGSSSVFREHLRKIGINFPGKPSGPGLFFAGKFFYCLFNALIVGHSHFLFLHVFSLGLFLGIYPLIWAVHFFGA